MPSVRRVSVVAPGAHLRHAAVREQDELRRVHRLPLAVRAREVWLAGNSEDQPCEAQCANASSGVPQRHHGCLRSLAVRSHQPALVWIRAGTLAVHSLRQWTRDALRGGRGRGMPAASNGKSCTEDPAPGTATLADGVAVCAGHNCWRCSAGWRPCDAPRGASLAHKTYVTTSPSPLPVYGSPGRGATTVSTLVSDPEAPWLSVTVTRIV